MQPKKTPYLFEAQCLSGERMVMATVLDTLKKTGYT
jgi:hypothetical protein